MSDQFIYIDQNSAMYADSTPRALPVVDESTATGNFGASVYAKGGSMLRMIEAFLGADVFLDGIRQYLQKYQYRNANSNDLFVELSAASLRAGTPVNVTQYMANWIQQRQTARIVTQPVSSAPRSADHLSAVRAVAPPQPATLW
jgi:aminopeptidase N